MSLELWDCPGMSRRAGRKPAIAAPGRGSYNRNPMTSQPRNAAILVFDEVDAALFLVQKLAGTGAHAEVAEEMEYGGPPQEAGGK